MTNKLELLNRLLNRDAEKIMTDVVVRRVISTAPAATAAVETRINLKVEDGEISRRT